MKPFFAAGMKFYDRWHLLCSLLANVTLACISWVHMFPGHVSSVLLDDSMIAITAFMVGSILSVTRFKNFSLLVKVCALLLTMAKHYVQTHPEFKAKLSEEVQTDLARLHHQHVSSPQSLQYGHETGAAG